MLQDSAASPWRPGHTRQRKSVGGIDAAFPRRSTPKQLSLQFLAQQGCANQPFPAKSNDQPWPNAHPEPPRKLRAPSMGGQPGALEAPPRVKRPRVTFDPLGRRQKSEEERGFEEYLEGLPEAVPKSAYIALLLDYLSLKQSLHARLPLLADCSRATEKNLFFAYKTESKHCASKSQSFMPGAALAGTARGSSSGRRPPKSLLALGIPASVPEKPAAPLPGQAMEFTFSSARRGLQCRRP